MKYLDLELFKNSTVPMLTNNICLLERCPTSDLVSNHLRNAFDRFIPMIGYYNCWDTIKSIDGMFGNCLSNRERSKAIDADIEQIVVSGYVPSKAVVMFCYIVRLAAPAKGYLTLAYLMANKILIENLVGYLIIPDNSVPNFVKIVEEFVEYDDPTELVQSLNKYVHYE